jgi:uncharacterized protein (TIGR02118 family)
MVRMHVWLKKKDGMSPEEFREYWAERHAPIARDGYAGLRGYEVNVVTRVVGDAEAPYDGLAVLSWDSREDFSADMKSDAARLATEDLANFTSASGVLFVDTELVT